MSRANGITVDRLVVDHRTRAGSIRAVDIAALDVLGGSRIALVGPSGCGKSSALGVVAGLVPPTSGTVSIGGTPLSELSETDRVAFRRSTIGVVYQDDNLLPFLTLAENILLQLSITGHVPPSPGRVQALLDKVGLGPLSDRLPDHVSGGQRQRGAVARAVVHDPAVILADEPTGSLDADNARAVVDLLCDASDRLSATLVVVTHDPAVASAMDRIVTLLDGAIADDRET